jgi:hypothetical protein
MEQPFSSEEEAAKRTYRTLGKKTLDSEGDWTDVADVDDPVAGGVFATAAVRHAVELEDPGLAVLDATRRPYWLRKSGSRSLNVVSAMFLIST